MFSKDLINMCALESILTDYLGKDRLSSRMRAVVIRDIHSQITMSAYDIMRDYACDLNNPLQNGSSCNVQNVLPDVMLEMDE